MVEPRWSRSGPQSVQHNLDVTLPGVAPLGMGGRLDGGADERADIVRIEPAANRTRLLRAADQPVDGLVQLLLRLRHCGEAAALLDAPEESPIAAAGLGDTPYERLEGPARI